MRTTFCTSNSFRSNTSNDTFVYVVMRLDKSGRVYTPITNIHLEQEDILTCHLSKPEPISLEDDTSFVESGFLSFKKLEDAVWWKEGLEGKREQYDFRKEFGDETKYVILEGMLPYGTLFYTGWPYGYGRLVAYMSNMIYIARD